MSSMAQRTSGKFWQNARALARERITHVDRLAWRRFFLALFALALSFLLALYSTALSESGRSELAAWVAGLALLLAGIVAVRAVPYLARRTALERWFGKFEYELTREGVVYLMIIVVIAVAALNTGNNLLFIILASLLAGILVSGTLSRVVLSNLELEFVLPDHIFAEHPVVSRLTVANGKWLFPSFSVTVSSREAARKARSLRFPTLGRRGHWSAAPTGAQRAPLPKHGIGRPQILSDPVYIPYIPRRSSVTQRVELTFRRRGRYTQEGFRVSSKFPFGFLRKAREATTQKQILVFPKVQPTEEFYEILPLIGGEMESLYKGQGHDLYAIRDYHESDTARHVDWKATAKTQQIKVREYTREDERRLVLVLDTRLLSADEERIDKFEKAVTFCACLAWHFYEIDAQMQFLSLGFETPMAPAGEIIYPVLESLALVEPKLAPSSEAGDILLRVVSDPRGFNIILTSQPRGSIPTSLWGSSYVIFIDSL